MGKASHWRGHHQKSNVWFTQTNSKRKHGFSNKWRSIRSPGEWTMLSCKWFVRKEHNSAYNSNWLVVDLPLWKICESQLGWWHSQYDGKVIKFHGSKPPTVVHFRKSLSFPLNMAMDQHWRPRQTADFGLIIEYQSSNFWGIEWHWPRAIPIYTCIYIYTHIKLYIYIYYIKYKCTY